MPTLTKHTLIYNARTAAYAAVWNQPSKPIPAAMKAARDAVGVLHPDEDLLRAIAWDAIWAVADGNDWAAKCFCIVNNVSNSTCVDMVNFNALEYLGRPGLLHAVAQAASWRAIMDTCTYETWSKAYKLCLRQAREILGANSD